MIESLIKDLDNISLGEVLAKIAKPDIVETGLDENIIQILNEFYNDRMTRVNEDIDILINKIQRDFMIKQKLKTFSAHNLNEKLEIILSKQTIPNSIISNLKPEIIRKIEYHRKRLDSKKDYPESSSYENYKINLKLLLRNDFSLLEPNMLIKKESKFEPRIAAKIPRGIYEENIKRMSTGEEYNLRWQDGIIRDSAGLQIVTLKGYKNKNKSNSLKDDPITKFSSYFKSHESLPDFEIIEYKNWYEDPGNYNAIHIKMKYNPIKNSKFISLDDEVVNKMEEHGVFRDTFEVQIIDIESLLDKEIGERSQILYALRQNQFRDREFVGDVSKKTAKRAANPDKEERKYLRQCTNLLLEVLTFHQHKYYN